MAPLFLENVSSLAITNLTNQRDRGLSLALQEGRSIFAGLIVLWLTPTAEQGARRAGVKRAFADLSRAGGDWGGGLSLEVAARGAGGSPGSGRDRHIRTLAACTQLGHQGLRTQTPSAPLFLIRESVKRRVLVLPGHVPS